MWGMLCMFGVGLGNMMWSGYGQALLDLAASIYPGYDAAPSIGQVLLATLYGLADGAICGALFAWLYNRFAAAQPGTHAPA
jgi:hypothetical protein